jgi:hypothetical protein
MGNLRGIFASLGAIAFGISWAATAHAEVDLCPSSFGSVDHIRYCTSLALVPASSHNPNPANNKIKRAVVVIHGAGRNAVGYYDRAHDIAVDDGHDEDTVVVAPQFITKDDVDDHGLSSDYAYWSSSGWKEGRRSLNGEEESAFSYVDRLIDRIAFVFPNLEHVAVVGFSAGGQFVHRYAGMTATPDSGNWLRQRGASMSFGVGSPSSYLWLDTNRPSSTAGCADYDEYRYGLEGIDDLGYFEENNLSPETVKQRYFFRRIFYIVGKGDNVVDADLDVGCAANTQGANRLARASNFKSHVFTECQQYMISLGLPTQACASFGAMSTPLQEVTGAGHSFRDVFDSTAGHNILFNWK